MYRYHIMDDKTIAYNEFNKMFKEFVNDLVNSYPDVLELKFMRAGYKVLKKISKKKPQHFFNSIFAQPYRERILARDSDFFSSKDFVIDYCNGLKPIWAKVDDVNKVHIFDHLIVILAQSDKCNKFRKSQSVESDDGDQ